MPTDPSSLADHRRFSDAWNRIARKTRRLPLLYGTPTIVASDRSVVLAPSRHRFVSAAASVALGCALFAAMIYPGLWRPILHLPPPFLLPDYLVGTIGLILAAFSVLGIARANRIVFDGRTAPAQLQIVQGTFPFVTRVRAHVNELSVRLSAANDKSTFPAGFVVLSLSREDAEFLPINVAAVPPERGLSAPYSCLAQWMKAEDQTVVRLALPEGGEIATPKTPLGSMSSSGVTYRLAFSDANHAAFLPTRSWRRWPLYVFLGAFAANVFVPINAMSAARGAQNYNGPIVPAVLFTASLLVMLSSLAVLLSRYEVTFDWANLTVRERSLLACLNRSEQCPIDCLAAVQICPNRVTDRFYVAYELNLVFRDPAGERLPIICHGDSAALRADAALLAQFLRVPLLDHSRTPAAS